MCKAAEEGQAAWEMGDEMWEEGCVGVRVGVYGGKSGLT